MSSPTTPNSSAPPASAHASSPFATDTARDTSPSAASAAPINIVGAGLAGALLAVLLGRRGLHINLYDRRPDPRVSAAEGGRSINLALAARGIHALERAGVMERVHPLLIPMRGRMVHDLSGNVSLQPYGQREHEVIYSVSRSALNRVLIEEAARYGTVTMRFEQACTHVDPTLNTLSFHDRVTGAKYDTPLTPTIATDGAGSVIRTSLARDHRVRVEESWLDHDYKELTIPAGPGGRHVMDGNSLHIWPRGGFMLIALPNTDGSFTVTLFLARTGPNSFAELKDPTEFFQREFPDATRLMPNLAEDFAAHPRGQLGTVYLDPWHIGGELLMLGDAAHAIVPFHGQGMNAAFEDCLVLDTLLDAQHAPAAVSAHGAASDPLAAAAVTPALGRTSAPTPAAQPSTPALGRTPAAAQPSAPAPRWPTLFADLAKARQPNTRAIAEMSLENYTEMRDTVLDPGFVRRKSIAMELERQFPDRFIPLYSMVMFHPEIPYAEAQRRGRLQEEILMDLDAKRTAAGVIDNHLAARLISDSLPPIKS